MSSFTVLRDVSDTLKMLFKAHIPELTDENAIVYESPAEIEPSTSAKLSVFLYQITENTHLRNLPPEFTGNQMHEPPMVVDLYYMFTPYASSRETELIILERVLQILHDRPVLKGEILQGQLRESADNKEIRAVTYQLGFDEINKFWERFPNKPFKLSVAYLLTPVVIASERFETFPRVEQRQLNIGSFTE
ncbi:MAG TPA: DUF4255 domain-containing protein [Bacillota bacterium]|nr:DUF4255 domain-containing protein [Bacillota bacterium]